MKKAIITILILTFSLSASAQSNALTVPQNGENLSPVNLRSSSSINAPILSTVDMFVPIKTNSIENGFYSADANCTDGELHSGYIAENFVMPFDLNSTAFVTSSGETDFSYAAMTQYPDKFSEIVANAEYGQNVNVLLKYAQYYLCESNGVYGFIDSERLTLGWRNPTELSQKQLSDAEAALNKSLIISIGSKKSMIFGKEVSCDEPIITASGNTMVPIKNITAVSGGKLSWNDSEKTAVATAGTAEMTASAESDIITINGKENKYPEKCFIRNGRMYVPLRALTDMLGLKVYYFGKGMPILASAESLTYESAKHIITKCKTVFEVQKVTLLWPVPSSKGLSSGFGDGRGHKSIDITGEQNAPIIASASGKVTEIFSDCTHDYPKNESCCAWGYGNYVLTELDDPIDGQSAQLRYSHLSSAAVKVGDEIKIGDVIGYMGCTGHSTGVHLDFELSLDGVKTDPAKYLIAPQGVFDSGNSPQYTQQYIDSLKKD